MPTIQSYRTTQIEQIIDSVFEQFGITDKKERQNIATDIANRLNIGVPISSKYSKSDKASSAKYRADIRAFLVDTISELLYLRDLERKLNENELVSKELIKNTSNKIDNLIKELRAKDDTVVETFEEGLTLGTFNNTTIKDGSLRIDKDLLSLNITDVSYKIIPSESFINETDIKETGDIKNLLNKGIGSDSFWLNMTTPKTPKVHFFDETNKEIGPVEGVFVELEILSSSDTPSSYSIKSSTDLRIYAVYGFINNEWIRLEDNKGNFLQDSSPGTYTFVDNLSVVNPFDKHKILLHVPFPSVRTDDKVEYEIGLHNLKINTLFNKENIKGTFLSNKYTLSNKNLIKAKLEVEESIGDFSFTEYAAVFSNNGVETIVPILPEDTLQVTAGVYADDDGVFILPFPVDTSKEFNIYSENNLPFNDGNLEDSIYYTISGANSSTFVLFSYFTAYITKWNNGRRHAQGASGEELGVDSAQFFENKTVTDIHSKQDGNVFNLTKIPFINVNKDTSNIFTFKINGIELTLQDITPYEYPEDIIEFTEEDQYYLKDNILYFSFNLLSTNSTVYNNAYDSIDEITVTYPVAADSVQLKIAMYGENPLIDLYKLKLIGVSNGI